MTVICRKGDLARSLSAVACVAPDKYQFVPPTWVLPADASLLQEHLESIKRRSNVFFIVKPVKVSA